MAILAGMAVSSVTIVFFTPMRGTLQAALAFAIAVLALEALQRVALVRSPRAVRGFRLQRGGEIEVECASGVRVAGSVRAGSFVAPWLTIVRWRRPGAWLDSTVLVLPGMAPAEHLRRLRVLLRWAPGDP